jgi:hypothetical protein
VGDVIAQPQPVQLVTDKLPRADAFGAYRTKPNHTANPTLTDRGYTGHRMNNTGLDDLGLIYMNARYYVPEVGRFSLIQRTSCQSAGQRFRPQIGVVGQEMWYSSGEDR